MCAGHAQIALGKWSHLWSGGVQENLLRKMNMAGYVGPAGDAVVGQEDRTVHAKDWRGCEKEQDVSLCLWWVPGASIHAAWLAGGRCAEGALSPTGAALRVLGDAASHRNSLYDLGHVFASLGLRLLI